jgi:uncharacterized protein YaiI (UPF0178 family)
VREEIYRVAARLDLAVVLVTNGARPVRPPSLPKARLVIVSDGADKADDWIADNATPQDVCITADILLAARCLEKGARVITHKGHEFTPENIGTAVAGRDLARHLRELGTGGGGAGAPADRSRFLSALDRVLMAALKA